MKKSNAITLATIGILIVAVLLFSLFSTAQSVNTANTTEEPSQTNTDAPAPADTAAAKEENISMGDALFIGDSRTVGLMEYAQMADADFFANTGMSVFNIHKKPVSVPQVGKVTLTELLNHKKYDKIYIMLGINEIGYNADNTVAKYRELLTFIQEKQPNAILIIQANLHVTKERSDNDKTTNNPTIDKLNTALSKLADGKKVFYLDANPVFDDAGGNLSADKAGDAAHLRAKYYAEWGKWILAQTAAFVREGLF